MNRLLPTSCLAFLALVPAAIAAAQEPAAAASPLDLEALYDAVDRPSILGRLPLPERLTVGHAEIRPGAGAQLLALGAGGEPCGLLLRGPAQWTYRVEPGEYLPSAERDLGEAHGISVKPKDGGLVLQGELSGAAIWGWPLVAEAAGEGGAPEPVEGAALPAWLTRALDLRLGANPGRDLLLDRFNGDGESFRWALLHGTKDDFALDVDARSVSQTEVLYRLDRISGGPLDDRLRYERLVRHPIGRPWQKAPAVEFLAGATELTVINPERRRLEVTARVTYESLRQDLTVLPLSLASRTFDEDDKPRPYEITALSVDGRPAPWVHREGALLVALPEPLDPGETVTLEVAASGDVIPRPLGEKYWRLTSWSWYPKPISGGRELSTFSISAETQHPWIPIAPGKLIERTSPPGRNRVVTRLDAKVGSIYILAGEYTTVSSESGDDTIHVSAYDFEKSTESERLSQIMFAVRGCFESWFGVDYPFEDLQVVEINQWGWGQAPPGMIFLTREAFLSRARARADQTARENAWTQRSLDARIAHELAHAWFPHVAKVWRNEEGWLSESLADYTSAACLHTLLADRPGMARRLFEAQLGEWKESSKAVKDGSVYFAGFLPADRIGRRDRFRLLYGRGPLALHAIRLQLQKKHGEDDGDRLFLAWIRTYVNIFQYKQAETRHLIAILERLTGDDWQDFFDRHIYGTEHVELPG